MLNRRNFIKTAALAANVGLLKPIDVFASGSKKTTGYFGVHPFIEDHPDAVFIMFTDVDVKTNGDACRKEGKKFASEIIIPMDSSGISTNYLIPIKPNVTGGQGSTFDEMGIITDPHFVGGIIDGMKNLGMSGKQFHIREVNTVNWQKHVYHSVLKSSGADIRNMQGRVEGINNESLSAWSRNNATIPNDWLQWVDLPDGMVFRKIPYLWPINSPNTFLLNIAKFKAHSMGLTLCCKNFQGAVANGYQHFCQKMESVMHIPPQHRNPDIEKFFEDNFRRHQATLPRWDRPILKDGEKRRNDVDVYDPICQEIWTYRTLDNISATKFGLHIIEGIYGRDGNFGIGPNPEGNENNPRGKAWDYMTNILVFGKNPFKVDIVGKWLGGHEPGNFGFFHIAMERGMLNGLNPMNIPVYQWENGQAFLRPLTSFVRTPLKTYYLQKEGEIFWHMVDEPFDYSTVSEEKPVYPSKPGARFITQASQTASYPMLSIEYSIPQKGGVMLEILNEKGETIDILVNAIRENGYHMASWNTAKYESGKYAYKFRYNDYREVREIVLQKS